MTWIALIAGTVLGTGDSVSIQARPWTSARGEWISRQGTRFAWWTESGAEVSSLTTAQGTQMANLDPQIQFSGGGWDPRSSRPADAWPAGEGLFVVQFRAPLHLDLIAEVEAQGLRRVGFLPPQAMIVQGSARRAELLRQRGFIRWVGPLAPEHRTTPEVMSVMRQARPEALRMILQTALRTPASLAAGQEAVRNLGASAQIVGSNLLEALVTPAQLGALLQGSQIVWAEPWGPASTDLVLIRNSTGAAQLELDRGITGQGVVGEVMDGSVRTTHVDFTTGGRVVNLRTSTGGSPDHGTNCTSVVFGSGSGNINARGILPNGTIYFSDYDQFGNRYTHMMGLPSVSAVFQSNSWGNPHTLTYTAITQELDQAILDAGVVVSHSMGNIASNTSRPQAWAKNVVSAGAIESNGTLTRADDFVSNACFGPAADGRIKPDLSHFYSGVFCAHGAGDTSYISNFGGTSNATAVVSGHFGLLFQLWHLGEWGNSALGSTVFANRPQWYTAKALMTNLANSYAFSGSTGLTRVRQGWGTPDVNLMRAQRDRVFVVNGTDPISNLQTKTYRVLVRPGSGGLRLTLNYPDPAALPSAAISTINRLDLRATSPTGVTYGGNAGLLTGNESTPGGTPDPVSTLEQIWVTNPTPGVWTIQVDAPQIVQDVDFVTPGVQVPFALVASGVTANLQAERWTVGGASVSVGDLSSLPRSDGTKMVLDSTGGSCSLEVRTTLPIRNFQQLRFRVESSSGTSGIRQQIEAWDGVAATWVPIEQSTLGANDGVREVNTWNPFGPSVSSLASSDPTRIRLVWTRTSGSGPYSVSIDQTRWFLTP